MTTLPPNPAALPDPDRHLNRLVTALVAAEAADARLGELFAREAANPAPPDVLWWCSFADVDGFRGVAIVAAPGAVHAVRRTHDLGINPGGEVAVVPVLARLVPEAYRDRLLTRAETDALNGLTPPDEGRPT